MTFLRNRVGTPHWEIYGNLRVDSGERQFFGRGGTSIGYNAGSLSSKAAIFDEVGPSLRNVLQSYLLRPLYDFLRLIFGGLEKQ